MVRLRNRRYVTLVLVISILVSGYQFQSLADSPCGSWDGKASDQRIGLTRVNKGSGDDCLGSFLFKNESGVLGLGGYTLQFRITNSQNARIVWITTQGTDGDVKLLPSLPLEMHVIPPDKSAKAQISVEGSMTLQTFAVDMAFFLLRTALALIPGAPCVVPDEQLAYAATRGSYILYATANRVQAGDLIGGEQELRQVMNEFLEQSSAALKEIGANCAAEILGELLAEPVAVIAKLVLAYMTWIPVAIMDYFKYQGQPAYASLVYEPLLVATATSTTTPKSTPTATLTLHAAAVDVVKELITAVEKQDTSAALDVIDPKQRQLAKLLLTLGKKWLTDKRLDISFEDLDYEYTENNEDSGTVRVYGTVLLIDREDRTNISRIEDYYLDIPTKKFSGRWYVEFNLADLVKLIPGE